MGLVSCAFGRKPYDVNRPPCMLAASLATDLVSTGDGGELRYRCVMCGRGYRSRSSLTRHSRYECGRLGSRYTFTCTLCGKYFCRPDHLKQHILNIHGSAAAK
ncbi:POZ-, AT hook-, and zinc finger-containing protein 1 [Camponotus japonicus]